MTGALIIGPVNFDTPKQQRPCGKPSSGLITRPDSGSGRLRIGPWPAQTWATSKLKRRNQVKSLSSCSDGGGPGLEKGRAKLRLETNQPGPRVGSLAGSVRLRLRPTQARADCHGHVDLRFGENPLQNRSVPGRLRVRLTQFARVGSGSGTGCAVNTLNLITHEKFRTPRDLPGKRLMTDSGLVSQR